MTWDSAETHLPHPEHGTGLASLRVMVDLERAIADVVARDEVVVPPARGVALGIRALLDGRDPAVEAAVGWIQRQSQTQKKN